MDCKEEWSQTPHAHQSICSWDVASGNHFYYACMDWKRTLKQRGTSNYTSLGNCFAGTTHFTGSLSKMRSWCGAQETRTWARAAAAGERAAALHRKPRPYSFIVTRCSRDASFEDTWAPRIRCGWWRLEYLVPSPSRWWVTCQLMANTLYCCLLSHSRTFWWTGRYCCKAYQPPP